CNLAPQFGVATLAVSCLFAAAHATPKKDAEWNRLLAEAVKHGGVETISGNTGSYVFAGPKGMHLTITRRLDNKVRLICAGYMSANINVCMNWDTEKMIYSTRASESAPWVASGVPPDVPESAPETRQWRDQLSTFLKVDVLNFLFSGGAPAHWARPR
ncbi:MAG: hypothetical protein ACRD36_04885, partial [Candidatus Acidiferrum sp.]